MKIITKAIIISLALTGGVAAAKEGVQDPTVKAWMDLMGKNGMAAKTLGDMAGGKTEFNAEAAAAAKAALIADAAEIPAAFKTQATDPVSEASPEIWTKWAEFEMDAKALADAATAMDVSSLDGVKAGMGAVGGACGACHKAFRIKK